MPAIRYYAHGFVCAVVLYEVPDVGDTAYVKNKLKLSGSPTWSPVRWQGFICRTGARRLTWGRPAKLIARAVTNGNGISGEWRELKNGEYVRSVVVQIDDSTFAAYALVDKDSWPIVMSETAPLLKIIKTPVKAKVAALR